MNNEDKKLQKKLVDEMMKVSETNPDVMIYMQALMKCYEDLEKENNELSKMCELYSKSLYNADLKRAEKELDQYKNNWEELKKWLKEDKELAENNFEMGRCFNMFDILNKMKELEENK